MTQTPASGGGGSPAIAPMIVNTENSTEAMRVDSSGNVGIGTTSPNNQLVIASNASFGGNTSNTGSEPIEVQGPGAGVSFYDRTGGSTGRWVIYSERTGGPGTETLRLWSSGDKVAITQGGSVGIGLPGPPRTQLHTLGRIASGLDFESPGAITFYPPDGWAWFHIDNGPAGGRSIGTLRFSIGNNPGDKVLMSIDQNGNVNIPGNFSVHGQKSFVQDHPTDTTKQIVYVSLEGGEAGTYTRGTWKLEEGQAVIDLPEHFGMVTSEDGLSIQLTPRGAWLQLYVAQLTTRQLIVREAQGKSGQFDYHVHGVRKGYEHYEVIQQKK